MTDEEIRKDFQDRVSKAIKDIDVAQKKHQVRLVAEDMIGEHTKINVMIMFQDMKKHPKADLAQPDIKISPEQFLEDLDKPGNRI